MPSALKVLLIALAGISTMTGAQSLVIRHISDPMEMFVVGLVVWAVCVWAMCRAMTKAIGE